MTRSISLFFSLILIDTVGSIYFIPPPTTLLAVHGPAEVNITLPSQQATRSALVFKPGCTLDHILRFSFDLDLQGLQLDHQS